MASLRAWVSLVRFEEYGPFFLLSAITGALLAGGSLSLELLDLLLFVGVVSVSAFVLNDVTDAPYDARRSRVRNPVATRQISRRSASSLFLLLAVLSVLLALPLGPAELALALLLFFLCWGYSIGPQFKAHPLTDVVVHGSWPATYVLMGYALYAKISAGALLLAAAIACFSALSGTLQEIRDFQVDALSRRTTAAVLGPRASSSLATGLAVGGIVLYCCLVFAGYLPLPMLVFVPVGVLLVRPLVRMRAGEIGADSAIAQVRSRGLLLVVALLLAYLLLMFARV